MHQPNKRQKGFTLMEMLAVIFVLGIVMTGLFSVISWNFRSAANGQEKQIQLDNVRVLQLYLIDDIHFARDIQIQNLTGSDKQLSYTTLDGRTIVLVFDSTGLYRQIGSQKVLIAKGSTYESGHDAVYFEPDGMLHFNFYANEINALLYFSIRPIIFSS